MCTTIKVKSDEGYVLARTMDFEHPLEYNGVYHPRDTYLFKDLMGNPINSTYKYMGMVFYDTRPIKDGVNEWGLAGSTNYFHAMDPHSHELKEGKVNLSSLYYMNYALTKYRNVEELVEDLANIHISDRNKDGEKIICPEFHHMFVDREGRCVVVEPKDKEYHAYDNPYGVMTNSPSFPSHVRSLKKMIDLDNLDDFNGSKDLPGGFDPKSRFIKAYFFKEQEVAAKNQREGLASAYNILDAMSLPKGFIFSKADDYYIYTRYIAAYDTKNPMLTVKAFSNPRIYALDFDQVDEESPFFFPVNMDIEFDKFNLEKKTEA